MPQNIKRNVPTPVKSVLDVDVKLTSAICNTVSKFLPIRSFSTYYKGLEVSINYLIYSINKKYKCHSMELYLIKKE